jgi:glucan phosphorylase
MKVAPIRSFFDTQVKRIHENKHHQLNLLHVIMLFNRIPAFARSMNLNNGG